MAYTILAEEAFRIDLVTGGGKGSKALEDWLFAPDPGDLDDFDDWLHAALALPDDDVEEVVVS